MAPFVGRGYYGSIASFPKAVSVADLNDRVVLVEDGGHAERPAIALKAWRILVVDDDEDVHETTRFALAKLEILDRPLELLHAHSAAEAVALLRREKDVAVILLDVVMETEDAGLRLVPVIRDELGLVNTRIILRTGQPGQAPETETIARYDINDYKTKSELTQHRLFTMLTTALRSYEQLRQLDAGRRGLEKIIAASNQFISEEGLHAFAEGVITQIAGLIGVEPEGLVCAATGDADDPLAAYRVIAAAGRYRSLIRRRVGDIDDPFMVGQLVTTLTEQRSQLAERSITLYFRKHEDEGFAAFVSTSRALPEVDNELLEIFCTNIALCAKNIDLVAALRRTAFIDRQLGIPNRTALAREIDQRVFGEKNLSSRLALIDLDQFSATNELFGSDFGDALLRATAGRLRRCLPESVFIARLAGDAFAAFGDASVVDAESIAACFSEPFVIDEIEQPVSACAGLVDVSSSKTGIEHIRDGYLALRRAKTRGLGRVLRFSEDLGQHARERAQLLRELRMDFDRGQLQLAYQPQIDLATGRVVGAEALLRWNRPDGETVSPERIIPLAEQSGLIVGIGYWVLRSALLAMRRFRDSGAENLRMAVNVSVVQLRQPDFVEQVAEIVTETGADFADLELEITESVTIGDFDRVVALLKRFRTMGVTIAIDDFGTGYSSLSYLEKLPVNRIKIDRTFVLSLGRDDAGTRIARTIIALGHELGMRSVAEGVEDSLLAEQVGRLGCAEAQGFHYARPMNADDFVAWLGRD